MQTHHAGILLALVLLALCAIAHSYEVKHPVFTLAPGGSVAELQSQCQLVMAMTPEQIEQWIVARSSFQMIACPNCTWPGGKRDRKNHWAWSPQRPDEITCTHCGMVHLNDKYPMDHVESIADPTGQMQEHRYWLGPDGYKYYLEGKIENAKKQYMEGIVSRLAALYSATGEGRYARQAAIVLARLAAVYPHYNAQICRREGSPILLDIPSLDPPDGIQPVPGLAVEVIGSNKETYYPYWSNRRGDGWNGWFYSEMPTSLAYAYDRIGASEELDTLSAEVGHDVRANIEGFFRATANFARSYPIYLGNMDPSLISGLAVIGRVLGEPEFVHDALTRTKLILERQFFPDGNWRECAPSYHSQTVSGLRSCVELPLKGYSDPEGYTNPNDGLHIENLNPASDLPFLVESINALQATRMPHGAHTCIHDTWSPTTQGKGFSSVSGPVGPYLHWAMGHAMLGMGSGDDAVQAHLHFSGGYGHTHADTLNLILFGRGRELLSDIGYTHSIVRPFSTQSLAHNLVLVDGKDQRTSGVNPPADGSLVTWALAADCVQYAEARGEGAYPGLVTDYRRALALVALPDGGAYVVDVFRVSGGSRHDWALHGSADEDQAFASEPALDPFSGSLMPPGVEFHRWGPEKGEYGTNTIGGHNNSYGVYEDLQHGSAEATVAVDFRCADGAATRTSILGQPGAALYAGTQPSIRRALENSDRAYDYRMPAVLIRREGENLGSVFAAVHEPHVDAPALSVEALPLSGSPEGCAGIICRGEGFTDYHLSGAGPDARMQVEGLPFSATGRYAFVRVVDGRPVKMALVDGASVAFGDQAVNLPPCPEGTVLGVLNAETGDDLHALVVDADIEPRQGLPGERVIVEFGDRSTFGLQVAEVRRDGDRTLIVLSHRPGFTLSGDGQTATHTHHPHREMPGAVTFRLPNVAAWER